MHRITFKVPCNVEAEDFQAVTAFMPFELVKITTTSGIISEAKASYQEVYDKVVA